MGVELDKKNSIVTMPSWLQEIIKLPLTESELHIWKLVKVGGVVNGLHCDGNSSRSLPDVVPVHVGHPVQLLDVFDVLNPLIRTFTKPVEMIINKKNNMNTLNYCARTFELFSLPFSRWEPRVEIRGSVSSS